MTRLTLAAAITLLVSTGINAHGGFLYSVTDLGMPAGAVSIIGKALNERGEIAGTYYTSTGFGRPFLYSNGKMTDLIPTPTNLNAETFGMNNRGEVVGTFRIGGNATRAFVYSNGSVTDISPPDSAAGATATAINDLGMATMYAVPDARTPVFNGYIYQDGGYHLLPTLGYPHTEPLAINNAGQITGVGALPGINKIAGFLYANDLVNGETMTAIVGTGQIYSSGQAINDKGDVVGYFSLPSGINHAFLYSDGILQDLYTENSRLINAFDINNLGQIVGSYYDDRGNAQSFLYQNGIFQDVNNLIDPLAGFVIRGALAINDRGQILAVGSGPSGLSSTMLLTPASAVPEPSSVALTSIGILASLAFVRRRRKKA